jgi:hypothetical protein
MTRFDLTSQGQEYLAQIARMRFAAGIFFVIALALAVYLGLQSGLADSWTRFNLESFGGITIIAGGVGVVTWILSPGAESVEIDESKIVFEYPGGRVKSLSWSDPLFHLVIDHTSGTNDSISHGKATRMAMDRRAFQDFLTAPAFGAILSGADRQGLNVTERASPRSGWRRSTITFPRTKGA